MNDPSDLPAPTVPADVYDSNYYRKWCAGFAEWTESNGANVADIYPGMLHRAGFKAGEVVVDIGAGRGELVALAVGLGARRAIGIEYSPAAVEMAQQTLQAHGVTDRGEVVHGDARSMPVDSGIADLVTLVDVVEHLTAEELHRTLLDAQRVLKPGGRIFAHTMPNRTIYETTYRIQRWLRPGRRRSWPADPRNEFEHQMHVNEQTLRTLRRSFKAAGFSPVRVELGQWVYTDFVPEPRARRLYQLLAKVPLTARFGVGDLFAEGVKP